MNGEHPMSDGDPSATADVPFRAGPDSFAMFRRELRDLAALLVLPAMWADHDVPYIAAGVLGVLVGMLPIESAYARFDDPVGGPSVERWRPDGPRVPNALETVLASAPTRNPGFATVSVAAPSGASAVRVSSLSSVLPLGESGFVVVASRHSDFPTERDLYLLRVAVGQAMVAIHTARLLASERAARSAAEAALHRRNAFLANLAQNLSAPIASLSDLMSEAYTFAAETERTPTTATDPVAHDTADLGNRSPSKFDVRLSRREAEVLGLLAQGMSNKEIAAVLWLSERTVERHITGLYRKIGVARRSEATAFALRHSLADSTTYQG